MRKTKIVVTVGPSSKSNSALKQLIKKGVDVFRLNMSHGDLVSHKKVVQRIQSFSACLDRPTAILVDIQGPKIRLGHFKKGRVKLKRKQLFTLTTQDLMGDEKTVSVNYKSLPKDVRTGDRILLDDGLIELKVRETSLKEITTEVIFDGILSDRKVLNLPDSFLSLPVLTSKDKLDIEFAVNHSIDYLALSFVRRGEDLGQVRKLLRELDNSTIPIIAKIETPQAIDDLQNIIQASDGIMIARGDLGVELPTESVPVLQKELITAAIGLAKPVITATQMLESMVNSPRPTRAETSDVANAILDGTDALMLSAETAIGRFPLDAVGTMNRIATHTEARSGPYSRFVEERFHSEDRSSKTTYGVCQAALLAANQLKTDKIIVFTASGSTANIISSFRPNQTIFAFTHNKPVFPRLNLLRGVFPVLINEIANTDTLIQIADQILIERELAIKNETVVIVSGVMNVQGATNMMKIHQVGASASEEGLRSQEDDHNNRLF